MPLLADALLLWLGLQAPIRILPARRTRRLSPSTSFSAAPEEGTHA